MMRYLLLPFFLSLYFAGSSQTSCDYSINSTDSVGSLKETAQYLMYEKVFAGSSKNIFLSLMNANGTMVLNFQSVQKSTNFMIADCFDKNSKIHFQLTNGKIYSMIYISDAVCSTPIRNENHNVRILSGSFLLMKDAFEDLKKYPATIMRVNYSGMTVDHILKKELQSEIIDGTFEPERYFINFFKCIEY